MARSVPLSRFTSRVGGGSAFFVRQHMTFTELMSLMAFLTPLVSSVDTGWRSHRGLGASIGFIVGLLLGVGCFYGLRLFGRWIIHHPKLSAPSPGVFWLGLAWLSCLAMFVWMLGFALAGMWFTKFVIHHVAA